MYLIICLHRPFIIAVAMNIVNCANYPISEPPFSQFPTNVSAPCVSLSNLSNKHSTGPAIFQKNYAQEIYGGGRGLISRGLPCRLRQTHPVGWETR